MTSGAALEVPAPRVVPGVEEHVSAMECRKVGPDQPEHGVGNLRWFDPAIGGDTPEERLLNLMELQRLAEELRRAGQSARRA